MRVMHTVGYNLAMTSGVLDHIGIKVVVGRGSYLGQCGVRRILSLEKNKKINQENRCFCLRFFFRTAN